MQEKLSVYKHIDDVSKDQATDHSLEHLLRTHSIEQVVQIQVCSALGLELLAAHLAHTGQDIGLEKQGVQKDGK